MQTAKKLQNMLRKGDFDMWEHSPRMLPRMYSPKRLDVETGDKSQSLPKPKARRRAAGRGQGKAAAAPSAPAGDLDMLPSQVSFCSG